MRRVFFGHVCLKHHGRWFVRPFEDCSTYIINGKSDTMCSPIVPGHEISGHVAAVGDGISERKVGERVGGSWHGGHDGKSHRCSLLTRK